MAKKAKPKPLVRNASIESQIAIVQIAMVELALKLLDRIDQKIADRLGAIAPEKAPDAEGADTEL